MLKILSKFLPLIIHELADALLERLAKKRQEKQTKNQKDNE